jgi:hypothetical protein
MPAESVWNKKKAGDYLAAFFSACPGSTDRTAHWLLAMAGDNQQLQATVARDLRKRLTAETDLEALKHYESLWGLEFRTRPPREHPALRQQVSDDLKRLEALNSKPDAGWMALLRAGYKQSGASEAVRNALDDRIVKDFPSSDVAYTVTYQRRKKTHQELEDQKDLKAWTAYNQADKEALQGWIHQFTEVSNLSRDAWFYAVFNDNSISENGVWRWTQYGFGAEPNWIDDMILRMESMKKSQGGGL